ncbi:MAG: hypothetical protein AB7O62_17580 [Pirellulales bacterium]
MNVTAAEVDRIVREVLNRLAPANAAAPAGQNGMTAKAAGSLVLSSRVVSTADLEGRLEGIQTVLLVPRAVVTPAARDLLRQRGVTLSSAVHPAVHKNSKTLPAAVVLGLAETAYEPAALVRSLTQDQVSVERLAKTGLATVVEESADHVARGGKLALLLTGQPLAAAALANRHSGVRAACAADVPTVTRAIREIGVSFLAVDPAAPSFFALRQIIREFVRGSPRVCPAALQ